MNNKPNRYSEQSLRDVEAASAGAAGGRDEERLLHLQPLPQVVHNGRMQAPLDIIEKPPVTLPEVIHDGQQPNIPIDDFKGDPSTVIGHPSNRTLDAMENLVTPPMSESSTSDWSRVTLAGSSALHGVDTNIEFPPISDEKQ